MSTEVSLPVGFVLNEYRIESTLGIGGFGLTYLAVDGNLDLKVAIKEYMPGDIAVRHDDHSIKVKSDSANDTFNWGRARFLDESRTLASFRHPNIVRVMRFFEANQTAYMVMEFVAGKPLSDWSVSRRPLSQAAVMAIVLPLLDGLEVVHAAGYLHRDIKPANIFIRDDGSPVLIDFGSARASGGGSDLTAIVTPGYAPLEQYHAQGNQGPWSDIYSIGAVLYWMVCGRKPLDSAARARHDPLPPARQAADRNRYSPELLEAIDWSLSPAEEQRPQTVARLRDALKRVSPVHASEAPTMLPGALPEPDVASSQRSSLSRMIFDRETLKAMEAALTPHIGPIAGSMLRAASKKALTLTHLAELVSGDIDDEAARLAFVRKFAGSERSAPSGNSTRSHPPSHRPGQPASQPASQQPSHQPSHQPSQPTSQQPSRQLSPPVSQSLSQPASAALRFDPALIAKVEAGLAPHIGAMARVIAKRAAARARDEAELYLLAADEIEDAEGKKAFLRKAISLARKT